MVAPFYVVGFLLIGLLGWQVGRQRGWLSALIVTVTLGWLWAYAGWRLVRAALQMG